MQNVQADGTLIVPPHQYSPNYQFNIPPAKQLGELSVMPDNHPVTVSQLLSPFDRPSVSQVSFQSPNHQYHMTPISPQESFACSNIPINDFNAPAPDNANIVPAVDTDMNSLGNLSEINRLLDLDNQQPELSFSTTSIMNILGATTNADGDIEENVSDILRNMSLDKQ